MLDKLAALFSNGQVTAGVVTLVDAVFGLLVTTGVLAHAPTNAVVASVVAVAFTAAGIVLAFIQHSQHTAKVAYVQRATLLQMQFHLQNGGTNTVSRALDRVESTSKAPAPA